MISSASDKAKLIVEILHLNYNLNDTCISLLVFPSRTNLKLDNIPLTPTLVKNVTIGLDFPKTS